MVFLSFSRNFQAGCCDKIRNKLPPPTKTFNLLETEKPESVQNKLV